MGAAGIFGGGAGGLGAPAGFHEFVRLGGAGGLGGDNPLARIINHDDMPNDIQIIDIHDRLDQLQFMLGNPMGNPLGDPMFMRPPPAAMVIHNNIIPDMVPNNAAPGGGPLDYGIMSRLFRGQQIVAQDNLNDQLL